MESTDSFGYWVLRRRKALDLTREELASRVGCAPITIKKIERDERRPSRQMAALLADALELSAEERPLFLRVARQERPVDQLRLASAPFEPVPVRRHNLPAFSTSFVGRERDMTALTELLADPETRMVTVLGPGGAGKTRLAVELTARLVGGYPGGAWLIELAGTADPASVARAIAEALGVAERPNSALASTLVSFLQARPRLLLLLDNCEHAIDAVAEVCDQVLKNCRDVQIVATSRRVLGVPGEVRQMLSGLSLPSERAAMQPAVGAALAPGEGTETSEAVRLFVERARLAQPHFELAAENQAAIAQICRGLDGLPLAIELAVARLNILSPAEMAERLDQRFQLLKVSTHGVEQRHRALDALVEWSYGLLARPDRRLFERLSVFRGGFDLTAVRAIAGDGLPELDVLNALASLADQSMMIASTHGESGMRYRLLETLRLYGQERLEASGEAAAVRELHALHFLRFAEDADERLRGPEQVTWLQRLAAEHDNLRAALEWAAGANHETGRRLAGALWWYWITHGHYSEGRAWMERFLTSSGGPSLEPVDVRAYARYVYSMGFFLDNESLSRLAVEALRRGRAIGDGNSTALALLAMAGEPYYASDAQKADACLAESQALFSESGDRWGMAAALRMRAQLAEFRLREHGTARELSMQAIAISRESGDLQGLAHGLFNLGEIERHLGNFDTARRYYEECLAYRQRLQDRHGTALALWKLSAVAANQNNLKRAMQLREASLGLFRELNEPEMITNLTGQLASLAYLSGQTDKAAILARASLQLAAETGNQRALLDTHLTLGELALAQGDRELAHRHFSDSLTLVASHSLPQMSGLYGMEALARLAVIRGEYPRAVTLLGAADALRSRNPTLLFVKTRENWENSVSTARAQLDPAEFGAAWEEGRNLAEKGWEQAIAYAVS